MSRHHSRIIQHLHKYGENSSPDGGAQGRCLVAALVPDGTSARFLRSALNPVKDAI